MTSYSNELDAFVTPLYPPVDLADTLGAVVAAAGRSQLRLAETEKYPHVTFFFNGGNESQCKGEACLGAIAEGRNLIASTNECWRDVRLKPWQPQV